MRKMLADGPISVDKRNIDRLVRLGATGTNDTEHFGELRVLLDQLCAHLSSPSNMACSGFRARRIYTARMALKNILAQIDVEIARLQQARALLGATDVQKARRGRPKLNADTPLLSKPAKKKRNLSPEGRARIAEAVKRRWAKLKAKGKSNVKG